VIDGARPRRLAVGPLTFSAYEMGEGPLALCLHGFPDTPATWSGLLPRLAQAGLRAVAVTSRGYEPSSQPADGDYSLAALAADVEGWLDALDAPAAHLIGHDWGSSILQLAAARAPNRALSLTALAVPHPAGFAAVVSGDLEQLARSWYVYMFQVPGYAEALFGADAGFLARLWASWSPGWELPERQLARVKAAFAAPGVLAAALGYYRTAFDAAHPRTSETLQLLAEPILCPVLGIAGGADGCVRPSIFRSAMAAAPITGRLQIEVRTLAGHFVHLEDAGVLDPILEHISSAPGWRC
jgi:pimeloyl-ACP methyl ester carboxylesterase